MLCPTFFLSEGVWGSRQLLWRDILTRWKGGNKACAGKSLFERNRVWSENNENTLHQKLEFITEKLVQSKLWDMIIILMLIQVYRKQIEHKVSWKNQGTEAWQLPLLISYIISYVIEFYYSRHINGFYISDINSFDIVVKSGCESRPSLHNIKVG